MQNAGDGERSIHEMPFNWDKWIDSVGRMFISTSCQQSHFEEVHASRSQIQTLNESLQRQEEEKEMQKQRKDKI